VSILLLSPQVLQVIMLLQRELQGTGTHFLIGGSCGLQLHGIELAQQPRDLDIYLDENQVQVLFDTLEQYAIDLPQTSTTELYTSTLSHYFMAGMQVEAVGGFRVHKKGSFYKVEASYLLEHHALQLQVNGAVLSVMPLAHELLFNMLRDRPDRYEAVVSAMLREPQLHMQILQDLLKRNQWESEFLQQLEKLFKSALYTLENRSRG
jgi:hypothetical protein